MDKIYDELILLQLRKKNLDQEAGIVIYREETEYNAPDLMGIGYYDPIRTPQIYWFIKDQKIERPESVFNEFVKTLAHHGLIKVYHHVSSGMPTGTKVWFLPFNSSCFKNFYEEWKWACEKAETQKKEVEA